MPQGSPIQPLDDARTRSADRLLPFEVGPVLYIVGAFCTVLAFSMVVPMVVDLAYDNEDWQSFAITSAMTLFFGVLMMLTHRSARIALSLRQTFLLTTLTWVVVCVFSAVPFATSTLKLSAADAFFEAMSGLTTTGATVISGLDGLPPGLLMWRSLLQWLGGIGIIGMGIVILPFLRVGGMQLFRSESSDRADKVVPRASDLAYALFRVYALLTIACFAALMFAGMSAFDAVNHAMTSVSTGGFSTRDASIAYYQNPAVEWVIVVFMVLGGLPFVRLIGLMNGNVGPLWRDTQVRWYLGFMVVIATAMGLWLWLVVVGDFHDAMRMAYFNVVSVVTTTGFASTDYTLWGPLAVAGFLILTLIGGCTGSTSGGIKIFRFEILFMIVLMLLRKLPSPHRIFPMRYSGKPVDVDIMVSVMSFGFVYIGLIFILAVLLGAMGLDLVTAVSGAATAVSNVGPGLGAIIGPAGNFAPLPDAAKWLLSMGMLLGRLEFFTVLVLLTPNFWRQ